MQQKAMTSTILAAVRRLLIPLPQRTGREWIPGERHDDHRREVDGFDPREQRPQIGGHRHRGERRRRREAHGGRHEAGGEARGRVEAPAEQVVLTAGTGERRSQLAVDECPGEGDEAPYDPEEKRGELGADRRDLEAEAGEDSGADHVRHHEHGGGPEGETEAPARSWVAAGHEPGGQQPVDKVTRPSSPGGGSAGDASRLNRASSRRSALRFGRNTLGPVLPVGAPPSHALSAGRLTRLGAPATLSTGC